MNRKKDTKMTLRLCQEDKSFLTKEARKNKMTLSHYVRNVVADSYPNIEG